MLQLLSKRSADESRACNRNVSRGVQQIGKITKSNVALQKKTACGFNFASELVDNCQKVKTYSPADKTVLSLDHWKYSLSYNV